MKNKTCCFFGHREIEHKGALTNRLYGIIEDLITERGFDTFLFGSKSEFDALALDTVTRLKEKYPYIKRIYVRAEYPDIDNSYRAYLLNSYEGTYFPEHIKAAGRAVYVERNYEMIDESCVCVVCFNEGYASRGKKSSKSGTALAYKYAKKKELEIINVFSVGDCDK